MAAVPSIRNEAPPRARKPGRGCASRATFRFAPLRGAVALTDEGATRLGRLEAVKAPGVTDAELVEQARRGEAAAFGELVMRHQAAVIRAARVVCRSHEEAEDVAQEAFVTAWTRLDGYRGEAQFRTWLLTIAWRRALSRRESVWRRLRRTVSTDDGAYREPAAAARAADERLADEALVRRLRKLVWQLPLRLRAPLLLTASGDWTYDEMATALGVPSGTLKWRVTEARRRLTSQLEAEGFGRVR
jgi:RNA polymerase sigma-70 factor, ECF subfamily